MRSLNLANAVDCRLYGNIDRNRIRSGQGTGPGARDGAGACVKPVDAIISLSI